MSIWNFYSTQRLIYRDGIFGTVFLYSENIDVILLNRSLKLLLYFNESDNFSNKIWQDNVHWITSPTYIMNAHSAVCIR